MDVIVVVFAAAACSTIVLVLVGLGAQWLDAHLSERSERKQVAEWTDRQPPVQ